MTRPFPELGNPQTTTASIVYADASCTRPVACERSRCGVPRRFAIELAGSCVYDLRAVGAATGEPASMFSPAYGECYPAGGLTCDSFREVGPIIPPSSIATGNVVVE